MRDAATVLRRVLRALDGVERATGNLLGECLEEAHTSVADFGAQMIASSAGAELFDAVHEAKQLLGEVPQDARSLVDSLGGN